MPFFNILVRARGEGKGCRSAGAAWLAKVDGESEIGRREVLRALRMPDVREATEILRLEVPSTGGLSAGARPAGRLLGLAGVPRLRPCAGRSAGPVV